MRPVSPYVTIPLINEEEITELRYQHFAASKVCKDLGNNNL